MIDKEKRKQGKYSVTFTKIKNGITYTMIETIIVGRDFKIMNFQREYNPGLKYPLSWNDL